ncbi:MAG: helix-hairpin-helix domain-containing protein [Pseudomonadota bacterium]
MKKERTLFIAVAAAVIMAFVVMPAMAQEAAKPAKAKKPAVEGKVNINTATAEQLMLLPGVSAKKAEAVIEHRTKNGKFKTLEDLMKVKGIKQKRVDKLKDYIIFEGETTLKAAKK